jgi:hypothetical protein
VERPDTSNLRGRTFLSVTTMQFVARVANISEADILLKSASFITRKIDPSGLATWGGTGSWLIASAKAVRRPTSSSNFVH